MVRCVMNRFGRLPKDVRFIKLLLCIEKTKQQQQPAFQAKQHKVLCILFVATAR